MSGETNPLTMSVAPKKEGYVGSSSYPGKRQLEPLLATLLDDPILADVPKKCTLADVETLIGVEKGSAMLLTVRRMDDTTFDVAVLNKASVRDLKAALQKKVNDMEEGKMGHRQISWKHVWGNYCLIFNKEKMLKDASLLSEFGLKNGDELQFTRHLASREAGKHSHPKKRRFFHGLQKKVDLDDDTVQTQQ